MTETKKRNLLAWGIILIAIGLLFFLQNIDFNIWKLIARLWPLALIGWGIWKLVFGLKERKEELETSAPEK